jgi:tetratricopeptide (TPR) repeat protein/TolB-like protein
MSSWNPPALWERLKHDLAFRVATLYAGASWFLVEALDTLQMQPPLIRRTALLLAMLFIPLVAAALLWQRRGAALRVAGAAAAHRGGRRWALALTAVLSLSLVLWAFGTRAAGDVPVAAERIAVLPFHATGSAEVRELGIGMVDLLSAALSDVGPIRTVASRTILARVGEHGTTLSLEAARAAARDVGAGSMLTGSITSFAGQAQLRAELRAVATGEVMASAEVRGPESDVMALTDRLAVSLLKELWRARSPMPSIRTAGLTTDVPAALRAWLRGEQHLRALRFDSAMSYFHSAVAADSTFSLAWARLAETTGWGEGADERLVAQREFVERALASASRLPDRERSLLRGYSLRLQGSFDAFDSLQAYVTRYPDDPMGWYQLGDARFHAQYLGRFESAEVIEPFLKSTQLDPTFGAGLIHVLDLGLARDDRELFDRTLPLFTRFGEGKRADAYQARARIRWAPPDSLLSIVARELRALKLPEERQAARNLIGTLGQRVRLDPALDPLLYVRAADTLKVIATGNRQIQNDAHWRRIWGLTASGRIADALTEHEHLDLSPPRSMDPAMVRAGWRVVTMVDAGMPAERIRADAAILEAALPDVLEYAGGALFRYYSYIGDEASARSIVDEMEQLPPPPFLRELDDQALGDTFRGWAMIELGDTTYGLRALEEGLRRLGFEDANYVGLPWNQYGRILTRVPGREDEGLRMMRRHVSINAPLTGSVWLDIARALDRRGDARGAREAYQHAFRFLRNSDDAFAARRQEIESALSRLSGEPVR